MRPKVSCIALHIQLMSAEHTAAHKHLVVVCLDANVVQDPPLKGRLRDDDAMESPEDEAKSKGNAINAGPPAAAAVVSKPDQQAARKKQRASTAHHGVDAAPGTEAKPLSERLAANRKRSLDESHASQGVDQEHQGPAPKKPKAKASGDLPP